MLFDPDRSDWQVGLIWTIFLVGSFVVLRFIIVQIMACCSYCRGRQNLLAKYGKEDGSTYALVTGASEGLGLELCEQLAGHGFNIIMLSRNREKIDSKLEGLRSRHPAVKFLGVASDLSNKTSIREYKDMIESELAGLDIGVVCVNAGCWVEGPTDLVKDSDFERVIGLNGLHVVYLTKAILPHLQNRDQRSAILATSSMLSQISIPGIASYSATKAFVTNFMQALHFEVRDRVDVTCWNCGPCSTNLGHEAPSSMCLTPEKAVRGVLTQLGRSRITDGNYFFHCLGGTLPPVSIIGKKAADAARKKHIEQSEN